MTKSERAAEIEALLREVQKKCYHEPDSDYYEYCSDCGHSPYNVPQHAPGRLVPRIEKALASKSSD